MDERLKAHLKENLKEFDKLPKRVREEIENKLDWQKSSYTSLVKMCESPIEQLMAIHLYDLELDLHKDSLALWKPFNIRFHTQKEVEVNKKKYRLDFLIEIGIDEKNHKFAIECDGHDFHEKTKEQARRDKQRDRDLSSEGYTVIRFTGLEIYKNPSKCVGEVSKIISKKTGIDEMYEKLVEETLYND